ncbi:DUF5134 domain-containing protein [Gordonia sp. Z-3]|uniref:DUF5134 domain-containing protein n=1 Tax=Gordonia sp. Z-3 TaxID=3115408 RepID=UPI002E2AAA1B|nr:DUF5134 domain-containing protein [Gordonia sp. Z-3]MED5799415.1 DUF5134 domain-containing protein [Gordonia sp. Z-3]
MIDDLLLRWVVTVLFGLSIAQFSYSLVAHRMRWTGVVGHLLHIVMALAMVVMAWPFSMEWPTTGPMIFFGAAAVWFVVAAAAFATQEPERVAHGYHAAMMAAMAWMYAAMNGDILPGADSGGSHDMHTMALAMSEMNVAHSHSPDMGDMDMHAGLPGYATAINWVLGIVFLVAALGWLYLYFSRRRIAGDPQERASALLTHTGELSQVFMAAGMSIMFFVMV